VRAWQTARHRRELVCPLSGALAPYLGVPPGEVQAGLEIRPDFADAPGGEHVGALVLPDVWAAQPEQRRAVEQVIDARLGVELRWQWRTTVYPMVLNMVRAPLPPKLVPFAEWLEVIAALPLERIMLGLDAERRPCDWDTSQEDPHVAIHGGSRRGKTTLLLLLAVQIIAKWQLVPLRPGAPGCVAGRVTFIDPKRVGSAPLVGVPGVEIYSDPRDVEAMWSAVAKFRELVEDRYDALADDPTLEFQPAALIIDEVSMFSGMSLAHHRATKAKSDPALPPVWDDLAAIVWMGAQARAHAVVGGQRLDYHVLGGMIGSFGVRMLAGYQPTDYARLVGIPPVPRSQKPRGRFLVYSGGDLTWVQLVKVDDPDGDFTALRAFALEAARASRNPSDLDAKAPAGTGTPRVITGLAAAAEHLGMGEEAFRKARQRRAIDGEQTRNGRPEWTPDALTEWREARPSLAIAAARSEDGDGA
jgi:hypothetical protein